MSLRRGTSDDLEAIYQLNRQLFDDGWSRAALLSALESGYDLLLCEKQGIVVGYLLSLTVLDEIQIMQIAVAPQHQRQGIANRLTRMLIDDAPDASIALEVRASNRAARNLYAALGFEVCGCRPDYYPPDANGRREDAILMTRPAATAA